ncbi:MAG: ABC transporter permease [Chloroflexota bacterium]|nr:ABC transporter permease [Chloroflexota bacterium]
MDEIFGIPMTGIMLVLVVLLVICLVSLGWVAWRRPVIVRMGMRNIPRRPAQSALIILGLMLSTLLISAALNSGDTIQHSATLHVYHLFGHFDEVIVHGQDGTAQAGDALTATVDDDLLTLVDSAVAGSQNVDGILPVLDVVVPVLNVTRNLSEAKVMLSGVDGTRVTAFGGLRDNDGNVIDLAGIAVDQVVVNQRTADALGAVTGDVLTVYYDNAPTSLTVAAVAVESMVSGARYPGYLETAALPGIVMPLDRLQALTRQPGRLSLIAVSNRGGVTDGVEATDAVVATLETALAGQSVGVAPIKRDGLAEAERMAQGMTGIFLVLSLFSVAAGVLLVILIFTMLAAERRPEMGMGRALGAQRRHLIEQFMAEGAGYALLASLVGAILGVVLSTGILRIFESVSGDEVAFEQRVRPQSLIIAYCLGVVLTFLTMLVASWVVSRLNVVAAIRDIPDVTVRGRKKRTLAWGALLLLAGGALISIGASIGQAFPFFVGMSVVSFGLALVLRFAGFAGRGVYTAVGLWILFVWLMPEAVSRRLFGEYESGFEMFFGAGISLVVAAAVLVVNNLDVLLAGVSRTGSVFRGWLPGVRTAIAYPRIAPGRTGLTMAMFSLIVFALVMMTTMMTNFAALSVGDEASAGWHVRVDASTSNPIGNVETALRDRGADMRGVRATGTMTTPNPVASHVRMANTDPWKNQVVYGLDDAFIHGSTLTFQQRAVGYQSDAAVIQALLTEPDVVVSDSFSIQDEDYGGGEEGFALTTIDSGDTVFDPIWIELEDPVTGIPRPVKIIAIIDGRINFWGLYTSQRTVDDIYPKPAAVSYYLNLEDAGNARHIAREVESALLTNGVQAASIRDAQIEDQRWYTGTLMIMGSFFALGLVVGVAAVGVIAFRAVVERRQQIGMLRALGFQRSLVSLSLLIEAAFVVILGVVVGTILGVVTAYNVFRSEGVGPDGVDFTVPWTFIGAVLAVTTGAALLMTWVPAAQAGRIPPAEALRFE